jgi:2OG-Fe(II) oxygenase superfamily/WD domain, G-beta repeat
MEREALASKSVTADGFAAHHSLAEYPGICMVLPEFLSADECRASIALSERRGYASAGTDYPPSYRNNDRQVIDDPALAAQLLARLHALLPPTISHTTDGGQAETWALESLNERFRYCRYRPGQEFRLHQDGVHHRSIDVQSRLTFMIYLTDGDQFEGGDTLFYSAGPGGDAAGQPARIIGRVRPRVGSLIVFDHELWHSGAIVSAGVKHIMRSDILYRRQAASSLSAVQPFHPPHQGYVWALAALAHGGIASGGRDSTIRLWDRNGSPMRTLTGHSRSVLGLADLGTGRLASVSRDRTLRLWDTATGRCQKVVAAHAGAALTVTALPSGLIATGGADKLIRLWNTAGGPLAVLEGHAGWVWGLAAIDGTRFASASEDGSVKVWDGASGQCLTTVADDVPLRAIALSADGVHLVAGNEQGGISVWRQVMQTWVLRMRFAGHRAAIRRLRFIAPDILASTGEDNRVRVWRLSDFVMLAEAHHGNFVTDVLAMANGECLTSSYDGQIRRFNWRRDASRSITGMELGGL